MTVIANRYELGSVLGSGGFATVYRAIDLQEKRDVAAKVIPSRDHVSAVPPSADPRDDHDGVERFRLEALALSHLRSPNVARVYDFGRDVVHGLYLVMEWIDGVPLDPAHLGRVLLAHEVLRAARALLGGLAAAHAARIVHRDVKPANVIVPGGIAGLADLKVLDFGIARSEHRAQLEAEMGLPLARESRLALGTPAYMAPELLVGDESSPASDVYAAGLVLYELLGHTLLFPDHAPREQLQLRTQIDPTFTQRVPAPLDEIFARMLARDPEKRFIDACEALAEIVNMETAPIDVRQYSSVTPPPPSRRSMPPPGMAKPVDAARTSRLDDDPIVAFRAMLHALDLPMLDALARREKGTEVARAARALVLGLRLEIDAAARELDPIEERSDLGRAVAVCVLAPRARVRTKTQIERAMTKQTVEWVDTVDVEIGQLLVSIEAAICGPEEIARCLPRCERLLSRAQTPSADGGARLTLELAQLALLARARGVTDEALASFEQRRATSSSTLSSIARLLLLGPLAFRLDDHVTRASFEHAAGLACDVSATLLEARALVAWGGMLIEVPRRLQQGLEILERAATLLLRADAPALEHMAAHNRGAAYIVEGRFEEAARQFRRAREVASGEVPLELELVSGAQELTALLATGDHESARRVARLLAVTRNVPVAPREAMLVVIACSLVPLFDGDVAAARAELAAAREHERGAGDALLLAGVLDVIYAASAGETVDYLVRATELHRTAEEHGFAGFYWFDALRAIAAHLPDARVREPMTHAVGRLVVLLGSAKK